MAQSQPEQQREYGSPGEYLVVYRAPSSVKIRQVDPPLTITNFPSPIGQVDMVFRTRHDDAEFGVSLPRELWIEVRGHAKSLKEALDAFGTSIGLITPFMGVSANAAIGDALPHLGFDTTQGRQKRKYFQGSIEQETGMPQPGRRLNVQATVDLFRALGHHRDFERLYRASVQYLLAMRYWHPRSFALAVAHLFMGAEALSEAALRHLVQQGASQEQLARQWGVATDDRRAMLAAVRREYIFQGDGNIHRKAKRASDGFEHGFVNYGEVRGLAEEVRAKTAAFVREAIINVMDVEPTSRGVLLREERYVKPLETFGLTRHLWGTLNTPTDDLAAPDQEYPFLEWRESLQVHGYDEESGRISITPTENFTVRCAEGVTFTAEAFEVWGPMPDQLPPATLNTLDAPEEGDATS